MDTLAVGMIHISRAWLAVSLKIVYERNELCGGNDVHCYSVGGKRLGYMCCFLRYCSYHYPGVGGV